MEKRRGIIAPIRRLPFGFAEAAQRQKTQAKKSGQKGGYRQRVGRSQQQVVDQPQQLLKGQRPQQRNGINAPPLADQLLFHQRQVFRLIRLPPAFRLFGVVTGQRRHIRKPGITLHHRLEGGFLAQFRGQSIQLPLQSGLDGPLGLHGLGGKGNALEIEGYQPPYSFFSFVHRVSSWLGR